MISNTFAAPLPSSGENCNYHQIWGTSRFSRPSYPMLRVVIGMVNGNLHSTTALRYDSADNSWLLPWKNQPSRSVLSVLMIISRRRRRQGAQWLICYEWEECCAALDGYRTSIHSKTNSARHHQIGEFIISCSPFFFPEWDITMQAASPTHVEFSGRKRQRQICRYEQVVSPNIDICHRVK